MKKSLFALAAAAVSFVVPAHAAVVMNTAGQVYNQSFDTLASATSTTNIAWTNDTTLQGWSLFNRADGTAATSYRGDNGASNTGYFYSYGSTGASDRALGSVGSSSATGYWGTVASGTTAGYIALALTNSTGATVNDVAISYTGEQWRDGGNATPVAQSMTVQYGFGSSFTGVTSWTGLSSLTFTSPTFTSTAAALNGNAAANRNATLSAHVTSGWNSGDTLWLRWAEVNDNGSDHGLAIDNVQVSLMAAAVPEPETYALLLVGLAALGFMARRRNGG